jgi:hypothetical protein
MIAYMDKPRREETSDVGCKKRNEVPQTALESIEDFSNYFDFRSGSFDIPRHNAH